MAPTGVDRYWAGVGPKFVLCNNPNCSSSIYTGVLVHKKFKLGLKPTCFTCKREYKLPPGAEKPYLKGLKGNSQGDTSTKAAATKWGNGGDKDKKRIACLEKLLQDNRIVVPDNTPAAENKAVLESLKASRVLLTTHGLDTSQVDAKIKEIEAAAEKTTLALPVVEAQLKGANLKLQRLVTKATGLYKQLEETKAAVEQSMQQVEELEAKRIQAMDAEGFEPKGTTQGIGPTATAPACGELKEPPTGLNQEQHDAWCLAVANHNDQLAAAQKKANETFSKMLFDMENNYKEANKGKDIPPITVEQETPMEDDLEGIEPPRTDTEEGKVATPYEQARALLKGGKRDHQSTDLTDGAAENPAKKVILGTTAAVAKA